ncbi:hypothetical protein [Cerasicoccus arenae]|uniref:PEP-CTERM protein-sorting domain-containing protein n=1 Tax=Cerasicoccus arenae TaxID=424488 RepID=A0A8J3DHP9_9BACT|nr:hypothetical protein [Cerasicoccus arenae]MBK1857274.1 hypothetical protein [Cerasicoccus arenae]GHC00407.1 hypothetical protein GCM10007047_15930 [Cerasicoccus arenae]
MKITLLAALAVAHVSFGSPFTDDFANTNNLNVFGNASIATSSNILTLSRTDSVGDAGLDWLIDGTTRFSLDFGDAQSVLEITPNAAITDGQWSAFILFFDGGGVFQAERTLFGFSDSTSFTSANIADFAISEGFPTAATYQLRVRLQGETASGFEFSEFAAVPEPSHYALFGGFLMGAIVIWRRRLHA